MMKAIAKKCIGCDYLVKDGTCASFPELCFPLRTDENSCMNVKSCNRGNGTTDNLPVEEN